MIEIGHDLLGSLPGIRAAKDVAAQANTGKSVIGDRRRIWYPFPVPVVHLSHRVT
jgi:hypothetical protein